MPEEIVITTGARLHFGFFAHQPRSAATASQTSLDSPGSRLERSNYGGIGLMLDSPGFVLSASRTQSADSKSHVAPLNAEGPAEANSLAQCDEACRRAARLLSSYREAAPSVHPIPPCRIGISRVIAPHRGLGSGTQLGMAVAQTLALLSGEGHVDVITLAKRVGRGRRSAVGIHGFARGGFLVDGGKASEDQIGPLVARADVPASWRFLLVTPADPSGDALAGLSGDGERDALERLPPMPVRLTERLCRLVLLEMLPALSTADLGRFGEALFEFGHSVGEYFRPVQGSQYADPTMAELVSWLRSRGVGGVAQTSWGPTIAVCCPDASSAESLRKSILADNRWSTCETLVAAPLNTGAAIQFSTDSSR